MNDMRPSEDARLPFGSYLVICEGFSLPFFKLFAASGREYLGSIPQGVVGSLVEMVPFSVSLKVHVDYTILYFIQVWCWLKSCFN